MAFPISQTNEEAVFKRVSAVCQDVLKDAENDNENNDEEKETSSLVEKIPLTGMI